MYGGTIGLYMKKKITIYYDADCGFCKKACLTIKKILFLNNAEIAIITSDTEANRIFLKEYSWVVCEHDTQRHFSKSTAWWRLIRASKFSFFYTISKIPGVLWLGDTIYDMVALNRPKTCEA